MGLVEFYLLWYMGVNRLVISDRFQSLLLDALAQNKNNQKTGLFFDNLSLLAFNNFLFFLQLFT